MIADKKTGLKLLTLLTVLTAAVMGLMFSMSKLISISHDTTVKKEKLVIDVVPDGEELSFNLEDKVKPILGKIGNLTDVQNDIVLEDLVVDLTTGIEDYVLEFTDFFGKKQEYSLKFDYVNYIKFIELDHARNEVGVVLVSPKAEVFNGEMIPEGEWYFDKEMSIEFDQREIGKQTKAYAILSEPPKVDFNVTFDLGDNNQIEKTLVEGSKLGDLDIPQPQPQAGYKFAGWDPALDLDLVIDRNLHYEAQYEIDETQKEFNYVINYLEKDTDQLIKSVTNKGYINENIEVTDLDIPGYKLVDGQETSLLVLEDNSAKLDLYYEKDTNKWITITFEESEGVTLTGNLTYEVIKDLALNDELQPTITLPAAEAKAGYKLKDPLFVDSLENAYQETLVLDADTTFTAQYEIDKTNKDFAYEINFLLEEDNTVLKEQVRGTGYIGQVITPDTEVLGFKLVEGQTTEVTVLEDNSAKLDLYYGKDSSEWVVLTFASDENTDIIGTLEYEVIKGLALNEANQPTIELPNVKAKPGYMLSDPVWTPNFALTNVLTENQTYTATSIIDITQEKYSYEINFLLEEDNTVLKEQVIGSAYAGVVIEPETEIKGYKLVDGQVTEVTVLDDNTTKLDLYYEKDETEWITLTFTHDENTTLTGTLEYEVIKDVSLNGDNQPEIILPTAEANAGYKLKDPLWDPAFSLDNVVTDDLLTQTYTARSEADQLQTNYKYVVNFLSEEDNSVLKDQITGKGYIGEIVTLTLEQLEVSGYKLVEDQETSLEILKDNSASLDVYYEKDQIEWVTVTFTHDENTTLRGKTEYEVIKGISLRGKNQPDLVVPTPVANPGYELADPIWDKEVSRDTVFNEDTEIKATSIPDVTQTNYKYVVNFLEEGSNQELARAK